MKNKPNHLFIGIFSLLSLTAFAGNKDANQMLHASAKNTYLFEENKGQIKDQNWQPRPDVLFSGEANGLVHHVLANGISYQMTKVESMKPAEQHFRKGGMPGSEAEMVPDQIGIYRVDVRWVNSNPNMEIIKSNPSKDYNNYYNVPEGVEPALYVRKYEKITLKNIWQGIDLEYYSKDGILESDWIVHQASDLDKIKFTIQGADLSIDTEGNLVMQTPYGTIKEGSLKVFQSGKTLEASWKLNGEELSFSVKNFNPELPIRIDPPTILWGTYYGGSNGDKCNGITSNSFEDIMVCGRTYSAASISTNGAHQTSLGGAYWDAFIVKFNSTGIRLWGTYYGGSDYEEAYSIAIDTSECILVTGRTTSTNAISTNGAHQTSYGGNHDAFILKFDSAGTRIWGTYYGGDSWDYGYGIASDRFGNILVTGFTNSSTDIATLGAHDSSLGVYDAFIVKFDGMGTRLWGTYYGETSETIGNCVVTDFSGNVYVTGTTNSSTSIATIGAYQTVIGSTTFNDAFIVKFDSIGKRLWGTYYGGSNIDYGWGIAIDVIGNVLVTGDTYSDSAIASNGAHDLSLSGFSDAFIVKFDSSGMRLWGTYYGGGNEDNGRGIVTDATGIIFVTGFTTSTNAIATNNAHQTTLAGTDGFSDAFILKLNTNGNRMWSTYYGGDKEEQGNDIALDANGNILVVGETYSDTAIASIGAHQTSKGANADGFIVKFEGQITTSIFPETLIPLSATLYPNPSFEQSYLQILAETSGEILLEISDLNGRVLSKKNESILPGENCIQLNVQDFIPGIYFVTITIDGYAQTLKFCKE